MLVWVFGCQVRMLFVSLGCLCRVFKLIAFASLVSEFIIQSSMYALDVYG